LQRQLVELQDLDQVELQDLVELQVEHESRRLFVRTVYTRQDERQNTTRQQHIQHTDDIADYTKGMHTQTIHGHLNFGSMHVGLIG
jgi:hypothetical protein